MTESRTTYVIQMWTALDPRWADKQGQLTDGYETLDAARDALTTTWDVEKLVGAYGCEVRFRVVQRTVTETVHEIEEEG